MANAANLTSTSVSLPCVCEGTENEDLLKDAIEEITLDDDEIPGPSGRHNEPKYLRTPRVVKPGYVSAQKRYEIYCNEVKIADCKTSQVMNRFHSYIEEKLVNRKWLALWRAKYDTSLPTCPSFSILVEVDDVFGDQAHVSLFEPALGGAADVPPQVIEAQLEEMDNIVDLVELYPIILEDENLENGKEREKSVTEKIYLDEAKEIALVLDNLRFFSKYIRRDWDDEDDVDQAFDGYLRARLQLHFDLISGCLPAPLVERYNRTLTKYIVRRKELLDYQSRIQVEGEPTNPEAVECWRKYYEVLMLSGLLQIWETLQLKAEGPCFPRVLRRTKGKRKNGTTVTHLVTEILTPTMLRSFSDDTSLLQHKTPLTALQQCYEGDVIILYPGIHSGEGFHELTESVNIKGLGDKKDIIVEAVPCEDLFVNISGANITLENITFIQADNTEGALRVDSGNATVRDCVFNCDGSGITVREGAQLILQRCMITGTRGTAVELLPGCTAVIENNDIMHKAGMDLGSEFSSEEELDAQIPKNKGAIHLHVQVVDPPKVKMQDNRIKCDGGYGVTVGRKQYTSMETKPLLTEAAQKEDSGDAPVTPIKSKGMDALLKLGIEMNNNNIEEIALGDTA